jgi:plasmid stability protein
MHYDAAMRDKTLQIRRLPDDVYERLAFRARRQGRSLAQQAVADLRTVSETEASGGSRRQGLVQRILTELAERQPRTLVPAPEELVREDRGR